jgi:hypothetical protein
MSGGRIDNPWSRPLASVKSAQSLAIPDEVEAPSAGPASPRPPRVDHAKQHLARGEARRQVLPTDGGMHAISGNPRRRGRRAGEVAEAALVHRDRPALAAQQQDAEQAGDRAADHQRALRRH